MPRYFFELHNDVDAIDDDGVELPNLASALARALREARTMIQVSVVETGRIDLRHHIDVRGEDGSILHVLRFEDAVTVQRGPEVLSRAAPLRAV